MEKRLPLFLELGDRSGERGVLGREGFQCVFRGGDGVLGGEIVLVESGEPVGKVFAVYVASIDLCVISL